MSKGNGKNPAESPEKSDKIIVIKSDKGQSDDNGKIK